MLSLIASSSSFFVFIQFRHGIFNIFASSNRRLVHLFIVFVTPGRLQKSFWSSFFIPQKIHHHYHYHSTYCVVAFLRRCIYTLQHISEDGSFSLVCIQNQSLGLPLHYNTHHMVKLDHENLFLCLFSMFSFIFRNTLP